MALDNIISGLLYLLIYFITIFFTVAWPIFFLVAIVAGFAASITKLPHIFSKKNG